MKIKQVPAGGLLQFGRRLRRTIIWQKVTEYNGFLVRSGDYPADACEPENSNAVRRERGSNFFPQTNICTFLNSEEKNWFIPQHDVDTVDPNFQEVPGFLRDFFPWERDSILPQEITCVVPEGYRRSFGDQVKKTVKVSIPSWSQFFGGEDTTEGELFDYYRYNGCPRNVFTRTATGGSLKAIGRKGQALSQSPASSFGIPAFILLDGDMEVVDDDNSDAYLALPPKEYEKEVSEELHQILK